MRPIPAARIGDSHGILRAVGERDRVRLDELLTSENAAELFPAGLENPLGRMRQLISYARGAGLLREDRGVAELTEVGRRYVRARDPERPYDVSGPQAEWLRRQLVDKHMTDSIFHGLSIGLSLLSSVAPGTPIATLDFGRALGYLGRAGWDNESTLQIQGERYLTLLRDMGLVDERRAVTPAGQETKGQLTLPVHMSLLDLAGQLNPDGPDAVRAAGAAEWGADAPDAAAPDVAAPAAADVAPAGAAPPADEDEWADVGPGAWAALDEQAPEPREAAATVIAAEPPAAGDEAGAAVADEAGAAVADEAGAAAGDDAGAAGVAAEDAGARDAVAAAAVAGPVDAGALRAAAGRVGLRLPAATLASVAAALAAGRHLLLTGAPGAGKTTLALAVAEAAGADVAVMTGAPAWAPAAAIAQAAAEGRWVVVDDLDRADADAALGPLASLLAGAPVALDGGDARPADGWRLIATAESVPAASAALLGRFAAIAVPAPADAELEAAIAAAAGGDAVAAAAARRLLPLRDVRPLGAGVFLAAARHAAARRAAEPAGEAALTRELHAAYVAPLLTGLDAAGQQRVRGFLDAL